MKTRYKLIAVKITFIGCIALILSTEVGKQYADQIKPLIELILQ